MAEPTEDRIAERLARARRAHGWTLAKAASRAGVSAAHLSRLEKGSRQPSIGLLIQMARAYQLSLGQLVGEESQAAIQVIRGSSAAIHEGPDGRYASLSGMIGQNLLEAVRLELSAGSSTSSSSQHIGEEWLFVLSGQVELELGAEVAQLGPGDAAHFDALVPHQLQNRTDRLSSLLLVTAGSGFGRVNGHQLPEANGT